MGNRRRRWENSHMPAIISSGINLPRKAVPDMKLVGHKNELVLPRELKKQLEELVETYPQRCRNNIAVSCSLSDSGTAPVGPRPELLTLAC